MVVREGTHCGLAAYVFTKFTPFEANARRFFISTDRKISDEGSITRPSIESHIKNITDGLFSNTFLDASIVESRERRTVNTVPIVFIFLDFRKWAFGAFERLREQPSKVKGETVGV